MLFRSCCAFSLKLLFVGDVVEQMDAEHLLFLPLHWPENLRAGKIQKFNWTTISCRKRRCLSWNGLMTEWSLMTNLLLIINRENPSLPLASHKITCCFQTFIFSTDVSPRSWLRHTHTHTLISGRIWAGAGPMDLLVWLDVNGFWIYPRTGTPLSSVDLENHLIQFPVTVVVQTKRGIASQIFLS